RRIPLASATAHKSSEGDPDDDLEVDKETKGKSNATISTDLVRSSGEQIIAIPFSTIDQTEVCLVFGSGGASRSRYVIEVGQVKLFSLGGTPADLTRYPRAIIRSIQSLMFTTTFLRMLIIAGFGLLALAGQGRVVAILAAVPLYYLCAHSVLYTEYRHILAIHYFLITAAATTLYCAGTAVWQKARDTIRLRTEHKTPATSPDASGN
ncbi:MAG TPA: hypothetical protein VNS63_01050, partial [Blastocatellia bacterium]|nr:hypothetical protein [Blastocatellia bacterium]